MKDKADLIEALLPVAALEPLTDQAVEAIPQAVTAAGVVPVRRLPFRIGRESRVRNVHGRIERIERAKLSGEPNNDLYLVDRGTLLNISREHLHLDRTPDGWVVVDRGSACGTKVNERTIGGSDSGGVGDLHDGDVIIIGTTESPYRYRFVDLSDYLVKM